MLPHPYPFPHPISTPCVVPIFQAIWGMPSASLPGLCGYPLDLSHNTGYPATHQYKTTKGLADSFGASPGHQDTQPTP